MLTTQYLEEADHLADEIVVVDKGKVIAAGTPTQLKDQAGRASVVVTLTHAADLDAAAELMRTLLARRCTSSAGSRRLTAQAGGLGDMTRIAAVFETSGIELDDLGLARPSLDDVFLHLTGHRAETDGDADAADRDDRGSHPVTAVQTTRQRPPTRPPISPPSLLRASSTIVWRNLVHIRRMPEMLLDVTVQSVMFVLLFAYVFGGAIAVAGSNYQEFLLPGIMVQTMVFSSAIVAMGLTSDLQKGIVDRFKSLPIPRSAVLVGRSISSLIHSSIGIAVMARDRPAHRLADPQRRRRRRARLPAAAAVRVRADLAGHLGRLADADRRGRAGLHVHGDVPADVRGQHVRADGEHADLAADHRRVEPGLRGDPGVPGALGQRPAGAGRTPRGRCSTRSRCRSPGRSSSPRSSRRSRWPRSAAGPATEPASAGGAQTLDAVQEPPQGLQEDLGLLAVHPVAGVLDRGPAGSPGTARPCAAGPRAARRSSSRPAIQSTGPSKLAPGGGSGKPRRSPEVALEQLEVQPPAPAAVGARPSRTRLCSRKLRTIRLGTAVRSAASASSRVCERVEVHGPHRRRCSAANGRRLLVRVVGAAALQRVLDRRDVDDHQRPQQLRAGAAPAAWRPCRPSSGRPG